MKHTLVLRSPEIAHRAGEILATLVRGDELHEIVIRPHRVNRNLEQNAKLHAMLSDISEQITWHGKKLSADIWKRLCMAAYLREIGNSPQMVPAIDGNGFDVIFERTSKMPMSRTKTMKDSDPVFNELIEWVDAFGSQNGVVWAKKDFV